LRVSEARERAVLDHVADGIVTVGEAGLIESFNCSAQRLFGYTEDEVIGQPLEYIIASGAGDSSDGRDGVLAGTGDTWGCRQDGSCFPMEMDMSEMRIGERVLAVGCIRDITERRERAELERQHSQALRREAQRDRAAFDEAPIGSVITGPDGTIKRVNRALCAIVGRPADELIGTYLVDQLMLPVDDDGRTPLRDLLTADDVSTHHFEKAYVLQDGRVIDARLAVTAIRDDRERVAQFYAQIEDVTDAKRLSRELNDAQFEMVARLAAAAEFRDDDTGQHTRRVGDLSVAIAKRLGLPDAQVELIRIAAPLHDIGKIAVPDAILGKPGKLTDAEFEEIKTHTVIGAQMLAGSPFALLEVAEQIALTHHEKWDGGGYPAGLAGDAIPIVGRIVAIADVFDALTHERPYKAAWSTAEAIAEMTSQAGRHFDPEALDVFLSLDGAAGQPDREPALARAVDGHG
jgi:putative two-component system response regulator